MAPFFCYGQSVNIANGWEYHEEARMNRNAPLATLGMILVLASPFASANIEEVAGTIRVGDELVGDFHLDAGTAAAVPELPVEPVLRPAPPLQRFEAYPNERLSEVLARWAAASGYSVAWRSPSRDIELEAGMGFDAPDVRTAIRELVMVLAQTNKGLYVRTHSNRVIVVEIRS